MSLYTVTDSDGHVVFAETCEEAAYTLINLLGLGAETVTISGPQ